MPSFMCKGRCAGMQWLHCLGYRCVVRMCMGFDYIFIHIGMCFPPFPYLPPAFISKHVMSSDLSPPSIKYCCYLLLVSVKNSAKSQADWWEKILLQASSGNEELSEILQDTQVVVLAKGHQCQEQLTLLAPWLLVLLTFDVWVCISYSLYIN